MKADLRGAQVSPEPQEEVRQILVTTSTNPQVFSRNVDGLKYNVSFQ